MAWLQSKEGKPRDPEGVRAMLQRAYDAVSAQFVAPVPAAKRQAKRPVTIPAAFRARLAAEKSHPEALSLSA